MLEFKYDFLGRILRPLTNRAIEMNTDSVYLTLTESPIKECLTGEACNIFTNWDQKNCSDKNYIPDVEFNFLPRVCCEKHKKFDIRTLGFFKVEWSGTELVCLNSKKYQAYNEHNDTLKMAKKSSSRNINDPLAKNTRVYHK